MKARSNIFAIDTFPPLTENLLLSSRNKTAHAVPVSNDVIAEGSEPYTAISTQSEKPVVDLSESVPDLRMDDITVGKPVVSRFVIPDLVMDSSLLTTPTTQPDPISPTTRVSSLQQTASQRDQQETDTSAPVESTASMQLKSATPTNATPPLPSSVSSSKASTLSANRRDTLANTAHAYNQNTRTLLLQKLHQINAQFFERVVLDVLWAAGYGGTHGMKQHTGGCADGGIDGVILQDRLGFSKLYMQAKRFKNSKPVRSPHIRDFSALEAVNGTNGIFVTTSYYTNLAKQTAANYRHGTIVLIDGHTLTELMMEYGVGVRATKTYTVYDIDAEYFKK